MSRKFDSILCFGGEDWWYHNRGHYDMQMMRQLSLQVPVLYVNSIGMRAPSPGEGAMFLRRVRRKLASLSRGVVAARDNFWVFSPAALPGRAGMPISRRILPPQLRRALKGIGASRPLIWVACPPAVEALNRIPHTGLVYQRTDRFEEFPGVNREQIGSYHRALAERADLTVFCSSSLFEEEASACGNSALIDHGVDFERFAQAGLEPTVPRDLDELPRPRVGFVGGIDSHTFDPELFLAVAGRLEEVQFVLVGACSLPDGWCVLPNVHLLGRKDYEDVADYMAGCDVLIMPWNRNDWIKACNPIKLKEYLATGRPVVSTPFPELTHYDGLVRIVGDAEDFSASVQAALEHSGDPDSRRDRVRSESWRSRSERALAHLEDAGLTPVLSDRD